MESNAHREGRDTVVNRLQLALNGLGGPNCVTNTPGLNNCVWLNPFSNAIPAGVANGVVNPGYNPAVANNNKGFINWLFPLVSTDQKTDILVFDAVVNGKTGLSLPGGDIGWAAGAQYRDTSYTTFYSDLNDFAVVPCVNSIGQGTNIIGPAGCTAAQIAAPAGPLLFLGGGNDRDYSQNVSAVFAEFSVPIFETLQAQLAARYEDYGGQVGSTFDPKASIRWQIFDAIALRGSYGTTFRGPPLNQLDPGSITTLQNIGGTFRAVRTSGNPSLQPESATTFNVGAIVKFSGFQASLDYWGFKFDNPIVTEPVAGIASAVFPTPTTNNCTDPAFAPLVARFTFNAGGCALANIIRLDINVINGSKVETSGLDLSAQYDFDFLGGRLALGVNATYVLKYDIDAVTVSGIVVQQAFDAKGKLNYQTTAYPLPELKGNAFVEYSIGMHNLRLQSNYVDGYTDQRTDIFLAGPATNGIAVTAGKEISSSLLHNLYYRLQLPADLTLTVAVENFTDKDPPFARLDLNYDPFTASAFGRTGKIGLRKKF
jgi:iron complex outermembrane receptor protein